MFTVEIKVNGSLIGHIYGRNMSGDKDGKCWYNYEYYEPETRHVMKGTVPHKREDGIRALVTTILNHVK
jgi:hypothetical protein